MGAEQLGSMSIQNWRRKTKVIDCKVVSVSPDRWENMFTSAHWIQANGISEAEMRSSEASFRLKAVAQAKRAGS